MAPSYTDNDLSGITKSSSIPKTCPKPSQVLQAPNGLLKLKKFAEGSSKIIPSASKRSQKSPVALPGITMRQSPSPSAKAVCTESDTRYAASSSVLFTLL